MDDPVLYITCPFIEVTVRMGCDAIDRFGSFPLFILDAFADGYTQEEIRESSGFSAEVVEQHVRSLLEEGLLEDGGSIRVTQRGKEFLRIRSVISEFNGQKKRYAVNCYTGRMETVRDILLFDTPPAFENAKTLHGHVDYDMLRSPDYENVKEFMRSDPLVASIASDFVGDSVYFFLTPTKNRFSVPYYINRVVYTQPTEDSEGAKVTVRVPIARVTVKQISAESEQYKDELDSLLSLYDTDKTLLSEKSQGIVEWERLLRASSTDALYKYKYYDAFSKCALPFDPSDDQRSSTAGRWELIELPKNLNLQERSIPNKQDGRLVNVYSFSYGTTDITVDFDRLIQTGVTG